MFAHTARVRARPGKVDLLSERMREFARRLKVESGCISAYVLVDRESRELLGVSLWEDREAFLRSTRSAGVPATPTPVESLRESPPEMNTYEVLS